MRILLDTHVLMWAATGSTKLDGPVRELIRTADDRFVSAASAYEVAYKIRAGKLAGAGPILSAWSEVLSTLQADELSLTTSHMRSAGRLDWDHADPFDRMLVAQAQSDALVLVTADRQLRQYGDVRTFWSN